MMRSFRFPNPAMLLLFLILAVDSSHRSAIPQQATNQDLAKDNFENPTVVEWKRADPKIIRTLLVETLKKNDFPTSVPGLNDMDFDSHRVVINLLDQIPFVSRAIDDLREKKIIPTIPGTPLDDLPNVKLEIAMVLVKQNRHEDAFDILNSINIENVAEPQLVNIYRTICLHKLVKTEEAFQFAELLIQNRDDLPLRYQSLADSIYSDIEKQKQDPLQSVARLMADVARRQELKQTEDQVIKQEKRILDKLNEIISQMEKQKQRMGTASNAQPRPSPSDSTPGKSPASPSPKGSNSTGDVASKDLKSEGKWETLPGELKEISVKSLVKELPPHFQSLMKAYFQKLAEERQ